MKCLVVCVSYHFYAGTGRNSLRMHGIVSKPVKMGDQVIFSQVSG
jgi:hypothetical protein